MSKWVGLAALALLMAGCSGSAGDEPTSTQGLTQEEIDAAASGLDVEASETTGVIRGVVVDQAVRPVAAATVGLAGTNKTTTSNSEGVFGFDGLAPGTYFISASKSGYGTAQTSVDVVAGIADPDVIRIRIQELAQVTPFCEVLTQKGSVGFAGWVTVNGIGTGITTFNPINPGTFRVTQQLGANLTWTQTEVVWTAQTALATNFYVESYLFDDDDTYEGKSNVSANPMIIPFDAQTIAENPQPLQSQVVVFVYSYEPVVPGNGVGAMVDQPFDVYYIACYNFTPPEGYTFFDDGAPKVPQQPPPSSSPPPP